MPFTNMTREQATDRLAQFNAIPCNVRTPLTQLCAILEIEPQLMTNTMTLEDWQDIVTVRLATLRNIHNGIPLEPPPTPLT